MDELTMLVRVAGGGRESVRLLRAAGFRHAKDIAGADEADIRDTSGLSGAASRRLRRAAQEMLSPTRGRKVGSPRRGLMGVPRADEITSDNTRDPSRTADGPTRVPKPARATGPVVRVRQGVTREESSVLSGEVPREERRNRSFWRFG